MTIDSSHYQQAWKWVADFTTPVRTLDALHLALAAAHNMELITADQQLAQSADYFRVEVRYLQP